MRRGIGAFAIVLLATTPVAAITRVVLEGGSLPPTMSPDVSVLFAQRYGVVLPDGSTGEAVTMTVQPAFTTGAEGSRFALLLAAPADPIVTSAPEDTFLELAEVSAPKHEVHTTIVEDPEYGEECDDEHYYAEPIGCGGPSDTSGGPWRPPELTDAQWEEPSDGGDAPWMVGPYEITTLHVADTTELAAALDGLGYVYLQEDLDAVAPYLAEAWTIVAVRVAIDGAEDAALTPITLQWPGTEMRVPVGLARTPSSSFAHYTVYAYAIEERTIVTAHVGFSKRVAFAGDGWLARNEFDVDLSLDTADPRLQITGSDVERQDVIVEEVYEHIPVQIPCPDPPSDDDDDDSCAGCCQCRLGHRGHGHETNGVLIILATLWTMRPRRRSPR